jgi:cysteine desulfurase/selenocysteine lyase
MCGPTGIGFLYGKRALLEAMPPFLTGGDMIKEVGYEHTSFNEIPWKFEAGTSNIADAVALGAAVDYLESIGMQYVADHERRLTAYALERIGRALSRLILPISTRTT